MLGNKKSLIGTMLLAILCMIVLSDAALAYTATTGTGILKEAASEQVNGDVGFMIILIGLVLSGIVLMTTKNLVIALIVLVGSISVAMSPDLANGIVSQFS